MITGTVFLTAELEVEVESEDELNKLTKEVMDQMKTIKGINTVEETDSDIEDDSESD